MWKLAQLVTQVKIKKHFCIEEYFNFKILCPLPLPGKWSSMSPYTPREVQIKILDGASLVAQWLRICLPMQGTRVQALVWEDPTCRGATGLVSHNY